jgi:hypothetical protein
LFTVYGQTYGVEQQTASASNSLFMEAKVPVDSTPGKPQGPAKHSAASTGWDEANRRLCSVLAHPLGLPLLTMFDCLMHCEENDFVQALEWDSIPVLEKLKNLVYLGDAHLNLLQSIKVASSARDEIMVELRREIGSWCADTGNRGETILTKGISDKLNKIWTVRNNGTVSDSETPAKSSDISGRCDVLLYDDQASIAANEPKRQRASSRLPKEPPHITPDKVAQIRESNQAVALLEFGEHNDIWWKKFHQLAQYVDQKLEGKSMDEPMLVAVVTYDFKDSEKTFKFRIAVFLTWNFNGSVRMCLLWRACEEDLDTFIRRISTIVAIALCLQKWRAVVYPENLYKVLGPNCSKVASRVCLEFGVLCGPAFRLARCRLILSNALHLTYSANRPARS